MMSATANTKWTPIYNVGAIAAWIVVLLIPVQVAVFVSYPPPSDPLGFYTLFNQNWFLGLLSLDLLYIVANTLIILFYLGLFAALRKASFSWMMIAMVVGFVGISVYYSSVVAFEMLSLSRQYQIAETAEQKQELVAAGYSFMAIYKGSSFDIYYVLNAFTLIITTIVMFKSSTFSKSTASVGLISGILMIIPSTAGSLGLIVSLLSLIPWIGFSVLAAKRLFELGKQTPAAQEIT